MPAILIVDDDPTALDLAARTLSGVGFRVRTTGSADEALRLLEAESFDLVLLEILLPEREGIETIVEIRRRWPRLRVLAMSGGGVVVSGHEALTLAKALGAHGALPKPFAPAELLALARAALEEPVDE